MTEDERKIMKWMGGGCGVGLSSKAIALAALGEIPTNPNYPHDPDDFSRCRRLLADIPLARIGLDRLAIEGGPIWHTLAARWDDIEAQFVESEENCWKDDGKCYHLMQSIIKGVKP